MTSRRVRPLSDAGKHKVTELSEHFADDVSDLAGRIAYRLKAGEASADHVVAAADQVYEGVRSRIEEAHIAFGGVLTGLAGGGFIAYTQADTINGAAVTLAAAGLVSGIIVMMVGLRRR